MYDGDEFEIDDMMMEIPKPANPEDGGGRLPYRFVGPHESGLFLMYEWRQSYGVVPR